MSLPPSGPPDPPPPAGPPGPPGLPPGPPPSAPPPGWLPTGPPPSYPPGGGPPRRSRVPLLLALLAAGLVVVLAVAVPLTVQRARDARPQGPVTLDAVRVFEDLRTDHEPGDLDYDQAPPVGGPHNPVWLDCGVYDVPVPDENAVHDLEHGTVWISYDPDLADDDVATLADLLPQNGILAPYDGLDAPVVVTVWERQLALDGADDPRLPMFLETFGAGETAPEPFASCAGGASLDELGSAGTAEA